jgi:hypothetical protein
MMVKGAAKRRLLQAFSKKDKILSVLESSCPNDAMQERERRDILVDVERILVTFTVKHVSSSESFVD